MITELLAWLASLPPELLMLAAGLLVAAETTLGFGMVAPGEAGLLVVGTTATTTGTFLTIWAVTSVCAILGYCIGYGLGRFFGPRIRQTRPVRRYGGQSWDSATRFLRRRGTIAVMIAIYLPVMRTLVPAAAGAAGLPFRKFLPASAVAGMTWCGLHILVGAAAGKAARQIEEAIGYGSWILLALVAAALALVVRRKRRKKALAGQEDPDQDRAGSAPIPDLSGHRTPAPWDGDGSAQTDAGRMARDDQQHRRTHSQASGD
ncbi:membrane protein DedA, SNARE-associated domain [Haloechinothrix alba]|uniref:Membrane protein DedA, SNARE-associated domain n=1 Tax=Haloechinothrix alba TaxID=664784 RepID=A0A238WH80_9PSEU|nr:membrane protein DedA, SNARE-associated domain [Haloechinothrix alba]